ASDRGLGDVGWDDSTRPDGVANLSIERAVSRLERSFPERFARELRAFVAHSPKPPQRKDGRPGKGRSARLHRLLAARTREAQETEAAEVRAEIAVTGRRACAGCSGPIPVLARSDARYCSVRCRVAAHRGRAA